MPEGVRVRVSDRAIISALNTPGGDIYNWRDAVTEEVWATATATAPINDELNAQHRGGVVGRYKAGFHWDRRGSSGHHTVGRVTNDQDYAIYVELGRSASMAQQRFSWTQWGGEIRTINRTRARAGQHILRNALAATLGSTGVSAIIAAD